MRESMQLLRVDQVVSAQQLRKRFEAFKVTCLQFKIVDCAQYLKLGCKVTIVARDIVKLEVAQKTLNNQENTQILSLDVGHSQDSVNIGIKKCVETFGEVDILVNCAGTSSAGSMNCHLTANKLSYITISLCSGIRSNGS